ncbi:MAG TPA: ImmA/IrrE family metallo-endopeptidase, partial [Bryobacteraceae bacterium]|nr:ImmA/IrrE family metallo-endopeptidase [Bryobacteraceae bacterium]
MPPYARRLKAATIEGRATVLLLDCQVRLGLIKEPPVPVDEILERFLGFTLDLVDLGDLAAHGATNVAQRTVMIDQALDPVEHLAMEGRFNFTVAHEIGHIRLHSGVDHFEAPKEPNPRFVASYQEFERQADLFASFLLMPRSLVVKAWTKVHSSADPIVVTPELKAVGIENFGSREAFLRAWNERH